MTVGAGGTLALQYGEGSKPRADRDLYVEPPAAVEALCRIERFIGPIWDPAYGTGSLMEVLRRCHDDLIDGSDLHEGPEGDFLSRTLIPPHDPVTNIISNPPYRLAEPFVLRSLEIARGKVAMFLRLQWLEGRRRHETIFSQRPPSRIWVFPHRLGMTKNGLSHDSGMMAHMWAVWDLTAPPGETRLGWLPEVEP